MRRPKIDWRHEWEALREGLPGLLFLAFWIWLSFHLEAR